MFEGVSDRYNKAGKNLKVSLSIINGQILIKTKLDAYRINNRQLRIDGVPRTILEYLINDRPGEIISSQELRNNLKVPVPNDLREMIRRTGVVGFTRTLFIPVFEKDSLKLYTEIILPNDDVQFLIYELENSTARKMK